MTVDEDVEALVSAVEGLRDAVGGAALPLDVTSRAPAEASRRQLLQQLDDYVLPRLRRLDAPLLAVVGGSTGAGKSTLVNSLVGGEVSRVRGAAPDHPLAGARLPPRRPATGSPTPASCPGWPAVTGTTPPDQPGTCSSCSTGAAGRAGPARRPRHRLGGPRQPRAGHPAARGRRPLAVRHHRGALRRRGAVGAPAQGRRPRHVGGDRARPRAAGGRWRRSAATSPPCCASRAWPRRRCSPSPRPTWPPTGCCRRMVVERLRSWLPALARDAQAPAAIVVRQHPRRRAGVARRGRAVAGRRGEAQDQAAAALRREAVDAAYAGALPARSRRG